MKRPFRLLLAALCCAMLSAAQARAAEPAAWAALGEPGTHILMRHAEAPGTGDPANLRLGDCATQRNLSDAGRDQARRIGDAVRDRAIAVDRVLTSQWCRASETAVLLRLGSVVEEGALNSFFSNRGTSEAQTDDLRRILAALDGESARAVLVTHQVNITALTGVFPASGEMIGVRIRGDGVDVVGRVVIAATQ